MMEKVYVLNLLHRTDRKYFMLGHLETIGVPFDCVQLFEAKYGNDYETTHDIIDAAVADGFKIFKDWTDGITRTKIAYHWSWCLMLREIIAQDIIALIILDDRMLLIDWATLCENVECLVNNHAPFHILQMGPYLPSQLKRLYSEPAEMVSEFIGKGSRGYGDFATVMSNEGAKRILAAISHDCHTEGMFPQWREDGVDETGLFHYSPPILTSPPFDVGTDINHVYDKGIYS